MRQSRRQFRLSDPLSVLVATLTAAVAVAVLAAAFLVARALVAVSSDPLRDIRITLPGAPAPADAQSGLAGKFARGERANLLLLGYGGAGHDGAYLTDSIMLASIEPRSGVATLISIPRDLWVTLPANKYSTAHPGKINEAFAIAAEYGDRDEGMRIAEATLSPLLGVTFDRAIAVDFRAFRAVVDAIGGIDVSVDRAFVAAYPRNDDPDIDDSWISISFAAGPQHMDGESALRYTRARYSDGPEGSDFARAARQQKVILAAKDTVIASGSVPVLFGLLDALRDNVRTDLSIADMRVLADFAKTYDDGKTVRGALTTANLLQSTGLRVSDGIAYALLPRVQGWGEIQAYLRRLLFHPASLAEDPLVTVEVSGRRVAAGEAAVQRLSDLGFNVRLKQIADPDPSRTSVSVAAADSAAFLAEYFSGIAQADVSASVTVVTVRLGADWTPPRVLIVVPATPEPTPTTLPATPTPTPRASASPRPTPSPKAKVP